MRWNDEANQQGPHCCDQIRLKTIRYADYGPRDIPAFLALMDVFVLASTRESFPLAAREAMAAGKAVVAPRIGGCPEVVEEGVTGYLFESRNVDDLASRLREIALESRWIGFGRSARDRVERLFSRRAWVDGDEAVYLRWHSTFTR